jgi:hypothetical protein
MSNTYQSLNQIDVKHQSITLMLNTYQSLNQVDVKHQSITHSS